MVNALEIGMSALGAHQKAMQVTSHNIANAATPGYCRQTVGMQGVSIGGVSTTEVTRHVDNFVTTRIRESSTALGRLGVLSQSMSDLEMVYNEPSDTGLSSMINNVFSAFEDLSNNPESTALRTGTIQQLQTFTATLTNIDNSLESIKDNIITTAGPEVIKINELIQGIASLNQQISRDYVTGNKPSDLLDQNDKLIGELSKYVDIRADFDSIDGSTRVSIGGRTVVAKGQHFPVSHGLDFEGKLQLTMKNTGEGMDVTSGTFGARMEVHGTVIGDIMDELDSLASVLISEMNSIHSTGTSDTYSVSTHLSERKIDAKLTDVNLDNELMYSDTGAGKGIPQSQLPSFTDENGVAVARHLTINVYDEKTSTASKHVLKFDPTVSSSRSLENIIAAINNSGDKGGFDTIPAGGISGITASQASVTGGIKLQLVSTSSDISIDFSSSLDTRPTDRAAVWTGTAGYTVKGRYEGDHSYETAPNWNMSVVQGGTIGATAGDADPIDPPIVEFSYYTGSADAPELVKKQFTLDDKLRAGDPLELADGVYVVFDAGTLVATETSDFMVHTNTDEAGILPALGINCLFSGSDASDIEVHERLMSNSNQLSLAKTRSSGDNANLLSLIDVREAKSFGDGKTTLDDFYQSQVSELAVKTNQNKSLLNNQTLMHRSLENRRSEISGVNIDEEVGTLIMQQQAYTAAARVFTIAKETIDQLMQLIM